MLLLILLIDLVKAQSRATLNKQVIKETVEEIAHLLENKYVSPQLGKQMKAHLLTNLKKGSYNKLTDPLTFAERLKNELQAISNDKHVYLNVIDPAAAPMQKPMASRGNVNRKEAAFQNLQILPGQVGYVEIKHFLPTEYAATDVMSTMLYLSKADAVIFDLRRHKGGNGHIVQLLLGYLFEEPTLINTVYDRINDTTHQMYTQRTVSETLIQEYDPISKSYVTIDSTSTGSMLPELTKADVYVLTSDVTFSAGEEFVYDLKSRKRATIIGTTTGAGGNPTRFYPVNEHFSVSIPWAKSINPITGEGWEGVGVTPHIVVHPAKALEKAHLLAIDKLLEKATDEQSKNKLLFDLQVAKALYSPVEIDQAMLSKFAGNYGEYNIFFEEGILYAKKGRQGKLPLFAINGQTFGINEEVKVGFQVNENGHVTGLEIINRNGRTHTYKRM